MFAIGVVLGACAGPPPSHALTVRHPELKCALIAFSNCGAFARPPAADEGDAEADEDAGTD